jgi:hypothetical protein
MLTLNLHCKSVKSVIRKMKLAFLIAPIVLSVHGSHSWADLAPGAHVASEYGMACDGSTDDTAAFNAALTALYNSGGGTLILSSICLINGQITLPNNGDTHHPVQPSIRVTGVGATAAIWDFNTLVAAKSGLDLRSSTPPAKMVTLGAGKLELDHIALVDNGSDSNAFIFTTNTVLSAHDLTIQGNASGLNAVNDGIILGGSQNFWLSNTTATSFSGYGTVIKDIMFHNIRRGVVGQYAANSIVIRDNSFSSACGNPSGGAIEFHGYSENGDGGNLIEGNLIEVTNYKYGLNFTHFAGNQLISNACWDPVGNTTSCVNFGAGAVRNTVIPGLFSVYEGHPHVTDSSGAARLDRNYIVSPDSTFNSVSGADLLSLGANAARNTTTGVNILAIGASAAGNNTTGSHLVAIGPDALLSNIDGNNNTAIGINSLHWNTHGNENTAVGINTLSWNTTGNNNSAYGSGALMRNTTHSNNVAIGNGALFKNDANDNVGVGLYACANNTSGSNLVCIGRGAGYGNTTGNDNIALGKFSFMKNPAGSYNTGVGSHVGFNNTGSGNVFLGYSAGYNEVGSNKLYIANSKSNKPLVYGEFDAAKLVVNGSITVAPSGKQPVCSSATRFMFYTVAGGAGVKDSVQICAKDAKNVYAWRSVF